MVEAWWNLGGPMVEPGWNLGGTMVEPGGTRGTNPAAGRGMPSGRVDRTRALVMLWGCVLGPPPSLGPSPTNHLGPPPLLIHWNPFAYADGEQVRRIPQCFLGGCSRWPQSIGLQGLGAQDIVFVPDIFGACC